MFANKDIRRAMLFAVSDWTGGFYATPSIAGSRPGNIIAATWATMMQFGKQGYREKAKIILDAVSNIKKGLANVTEIEILSKHDS